MKTSIARGVLSIVALSIISAHVAGGQELDAILSAWRERTTSTRAVSLTWEGEYILAETTDVNTASSTSRPKSFPFQARLKFRGDEGDEVHYWTSVPMRNGETGGVNGSDSTTVVNRGSVTTISKLEPAAHYSGGRVDWGDESRDVVWNNLDKIPIILSWRSLSPRMFGYESEEIKMTAERGDTDECKDCRILEIRDSTGRRRDEFWVENAAGFPIVRHRVLSAVSSSLLGGSVMKRQMLQAALVFGMSVGTEAGT